MKLLFAHDHIFYRFNNQYYSSGGLSKEMLERYTSVFSEVVVISRQKELINFNDKYTLASSERVEFVEIPNFKSVQNSYKILEAKKKIEKEIINCDVLIARLPSTIGALAVSSAIKKQKKYLIEVVACPWDSLWNHSLKGKIIAPISYVKTKKLVKSASHTVYVTNKFLQNRYPTKGQSVNCSNVALKEFDEKVIDGRINKINNMNETNKIIIGTIAAINVKHKGQKYIIEALGKLKKQGNTKYEYHLVGGGDQGYLKYYAKKHNVENQVTFIGNLPHNEVFEWLDAIDIYVQPSRQEGLPRALIEAMSRGLPAFGARTAGIPELLEDKYIFSNTRKNLTEISNILYSLNEESMRIQAHRNYEESKRYDKVIIEERRKRFFGIFQDSSIS